MDSKFDCCSFFVKNLRKYLVIRNKTIIFVSRNKIKQYGFS